MTKLTVELEEHTTYILFTRLLRNWVIKSEEKERKSVEETVKIASKMVSIETRVQKRTKLKSPSKSEH